MLSFDPGLLPPDARYFIGRAPLAVAVAAPVLGLQTFATEEGALILADHPTCDLGADACARDLSRKLRVMQRIRAGTVGINCYGCSRGHILSTGGYMASGPGKDVGREAHQANRRSKSVLIDIPGEAA